MDEVVLPAPRHLRSGRQHPVERRAVQVAAVRRHAGDAPGVADVGERAVAPGMVADLVLTLNHLRMLARATEQEWPSL
jgi:hypothetical protein